MTFKVSVVSTFVVLKKNIGLILFGNEVHRGEPKDVISGLYAV